MFQKILLLILLVFLLKTNAQITAIKAGKVLDPATGIVSSNQIILIENEKVLEIGEKVIIPSSAKVIDLSKLTVMPGLIDAHTHICARTSRIADMLGVEFLDMVLLNPDGYRAIQGTVYAGQMLNAGFTTIREAGNSGKYDDVDVKRAINEGLIEGPNIIAAGKIISPFGGQFRTKGDKQFIVNNEHIFADTQDEIKKAIRENIFYGADVIKIVVDSKKYKYSADDVKFIVDEAGKAGLKVMAHCQTAEGALSAAIGGVASIEHGWSLTDSTILLMKEKGIVLVSTDFPSRLLQAYGSSKEIAEATHARFIKRLKKAFDAGVVIAFGTDIMIDAENETRGTLALSYIDSFVEAGIPASEILKIMTTNPACLLGIEKTRGAIAPGMYCDLIAINENPLDNIHTLKSIPFVMRNGKICKNNL